MTTGSKSDRNLQKSILRERILMSALLAAMFTYTILLCCGTLNAFELVDYLESLGGQAKRRW